MKRHLTAPGMVGEVADELREWVAMYEAAHARDPKAAPAPNAQRLRKTSEALAELELWDHCEGCDHCDPDDEMSGPDVFDRAASHAATAVAEAVIKRFPRRT